jgi:ApaG protein
MAMDTQRKYDITVTARASYLAEQSDEAAGRYVFAYRIRIINAGNVAARLLSRHWIITDADNRVQEVRGDGVVGEQPRLAPRESYEYTSGTTLATPVGTMRGSYRMVADDGVVFDAPIPEFTLSVPRMLH